MTAKQKIAVNINKAMKRKGKKTRDLAKLLDISTEAMRKKLNAVSKIDGDEMAKIGQYLNTPVVKFLEGVDLSPLTDAT